jgi:hypothetical protein
VGSAWGSRLFRSKRAESAVHGPQPFCDSRFAFQAGRRRNAAQSIFNGSLMTRAAGWAEDAAADWIDTIEGDRT